MALLLINVLILFWIVISPSMVDKGADTVEPVVDTTPVEVEADVVTARPTRTEPSAPARASTNTAAVAQDAATQNPMAQVEPVRATLPSRDMLLAQGTAIPAANITLHVFDPQRSARFILLDGQRLGEGDTSRSGLRVNAITADGVVFGFGNNNFKVSIQ